MELELYVSIAGVVEIHGRSLDGQPWPARWHISDAGLAALRTGGSWINLPTPSDIEAQAARAIEAIETWLGAPGVLGRNRRDVAAGPPASAETIADFETAHAFSVPAGYRELLLLADGIEIGDLVVLGTEDAYRLDMPGPDRLVIAPPDDDGAFVLTPSGEVRFVALEDKIAEGAPRARDLRDWVLRHVRGRARR